MRRGVATLSALKHDVFVELQLVAAFSASRHFRAVAIQNKTGHRSYPFTDVAGLRFKVFFD